MTKEKKLLIFSIFYFLFSIFYFMPVAFCDDKKDEPIVCNGDKIEYMDGNKKLAGSGNIVLTYEDMKLTSDKVEVNLKTKEAYATGNVVLTQGASVFKADSILYNFQEKKGRLINGSMSAPPWYGKCDQIEKVADKEYLLGSGYVSTCDRVPPHYKIRTKQVRLYLDDRIEAKNVVVCAGSVPVMFLPIYTHNVKNKKPAVAVVPGHSKEWGYYNLTAVRYNLSEEEQAPLQMHNPMAWTRFVTGQGKLHLDLRSRKGFASGVTHNYNLNFLNEKKEDTNKIALGDGIFDVYYMNEEDRNKPKETPRETQRYRVMLRHKWQMDEKTLALAEYNKLTDSTFIKDYFYRQEYVNETQPKTYISLLRAEPGYSAGFLYQNRINRFFTETEYMPQVTLDVKNQRLVENLPLYYKGEYSAANLTKKNANSDIDDDANRFDSYNELSYLFTPLEKRSSLTGFTPLVPITFNPYLGTRQSWYSKDKYTDDSRPRGILYSGIDTSTKFYKTYNVESKIAGTEIHGLRHIVTPLVRYKYIHQPTLSRDNLADFDDIDTISRKNALTFSLENDFQTRKRSQMGTKTVIASNDDTMQYDTIDMARFILSTDYNFQRTPGGEFTNIISDLELRPSSRFLIEQDASFNPHSQKFDVANIDFVAKKDDRTKLGLGHRYQRKESSETTLDALYPLTSKLGLHCYERYQFYDHRFKEQEYGLSFDLHCWIMDSNFNKSTAGGNTVWVIFRLKAFPDFPIQLGTTYEQPKPETIGN